MGSRANFSIQSGAFRRYFYDRELASLMTPRGEVDRKSQKFGKEKATLQRLAKDIHGSPLYGGGFASSLKTCIALPINTE